MTYELLQIVQQGTSCGAHEVEWSSEQQYPVAAANRRRILDRDAARGFHPGPDGWLTTYTVVGQFDGADVLNWCRIRWEGLPWTEIQDLDRQRIRAGSRVSVRGRGAGIVLAVGTSAYVPLAHRLGAMTAQPPHDNMLPVLVGERRNTPIWVDVADLTALGANRQNSR